MTKHYNLYLALGDSYTVGEGVPLYESFPYKTVEILRNSGFHFHAPEIIAAIDWTTFELAEHILHHPLNEKYDFVSLLIGVNNQFRELSANDYENDFTFLLKKAIHLAGEMPSHVIVLSIPDWSVTPFAKAKDKRKIEIEINNFNDINKRITSEHKAGYIDITESNRRSAVDKSFFAADKLHPSGKEYAQWAAEVADKIKAEL